MSNPMETRGGKRPGAGRPPGAPNKISRPLKELAALEGEACIATLKHLRDHGTSEQVRVTAAGMLLDRGFGKPLQEHKLKQDREVRVFVNRGSGPPIPVNQPIEALPGALEHFTEEP
jgi:hypothetical protein